MKTEYIGADETPVNPLKLKRVSESATWEMWKNTWENGVSCSSLFGELDGAFMVHGMSNFEKMERAMFFLELSENWCNSDIVNFFSYKGELGISTAEKRKALSKKSFGLVCRFVFSDENNHLMKYFFTEIEFRECLMRFFRVLIGEGGFCIPNITSRGVSDERLKREAVDFLRKYISYLWRNSSVEITIEERVWMTYVMSVIRYFEPLETPQVAPQEVIDILEKIAKNITTSSDLTLARLKGSTEGHLAETLIFYKNRLSSQFF